MNSEKFSNLYHLPFEKSKWYPEDRKSSDVYLPEKGDDVRVWGAWVKDKPKGWNEIHPAWKVVKK